MARASAMLRSIGTLSMARPSGAPSVRRCTLRDGQRGICTVRVNLGGALYTLGYGNPVAVNIDPIEKKPFFHVVPGSRAFSLAVAGCNMRCLFCQNWQISQSKPDEVPAIDLPPDAVVREAISSGCGSIVFTYTEPTVFYEYMLDIAKLAKENGLLTGMHTCGYINPEPLAELLPYMDAVNVDLKGFSREFYQKMGLLAELEPVLETLRAVRKAGVWLEITNLLIPGQNDDPQMVRAMCAWIKDALGADVPIHFSRFMPSFQLQNLPPTPFRTLLESREIARETGLQYVYIGNMPANDAENTYCPGCGDLVIGRRGYAITAMHMHGGACASCGHPIPGIWHDGSDR